MIHKTEENIYLPKIATIKDICIENSQIKTFILEFNDQKFNKSFSYNPGQFLMVSVPHHGEAPISFSSTPTRPGAVYLSIRKAGKLTGAMHELAKGAAIGLRGPYGKPFPMEDLKGSNLLFVAGGIGLAPLRSVINYCLDKRAEYGEITVLYGSRAPSDIAFAADIDSWKKQGVSCSLTVDVAEDGWDGPVGLVTTLLDNLQSDNSNTTAIVCGPSLMIRFVINKLTAMGFSDETIITTLERHMKCGVGICRHCHMDNKLVCDDGPVFSVADLRGLDIAELGA
ncbi:MAG: FAD/NAD(P)-binding protein [Proteobacteria bacterium]|nr:FAD/NAD(P)-binding protein [Pseudomonadota bacterium]MBU1710812.1 FAD/NAD(P)-binding protein [Pseudomonadota bacterium]